MTSASRLKPLMRSEWSDETRALLDGLSGSMREIEGDQASDEPDGDASGTVNIVRTIAHAG